MTDYTDIDTTLTQLFNGLALPGLAVGVFSQHGLEHAWTGGLLDVQEERPVTEYTLFHMASVTKPFVATAVMQLIERGLVQLNAPVREYLPYFTLADDRVGTITVEHLLSHSSGLPDVTDYEWSKPQQDDGALERHVRSLADRSLLFAPGERLAYSNLGFEVLGDLVAKVSGVSFEAYLEDHIIRPLGMMETTLRAPGADPAQLARGHSLDETGSMTSNDIYPYNRRHAPSSTLCSNVVDMAKWGAAWLGQGTAGNVTILRPATAEEMLTPRQPMMPPLIHVGLSWFLSRHKGMLLVEHGGGDTGFRSDFLFAPEGGIGVVLVTNCDAWYVHTPSLALALLGSVLEGTVTRPLS